MKLEPLFCVKNNLLVKLSDNEQIDLKNLPVIDSNDLNINNHQYFEIEIPWSLIELEDGIYNEEYLALLRDFLKKIENRNQFVVIKPMLGKPAESVDEMESFINAFNHTARRVKDCTALIGMEIPELFVDKGFASDSPVNNFIETLDIKHSQYVYFIRKDYLKDKAGDDLLKEMKIVIF